MHDRPADELLDIREAAEFLRVSETSLRRWTNAGRLPCLRIGGRHERRFRREDLLAFGGPARLPVPPPARNHCCGLYTSALSRARSAAAFLSAGLRTGALCLLAAANDVRRSVLELLERDHPSLRKDVATGRVTWVEYRESSTAQLEYWRTRLSSAVRDGFSRVHVVGDVSAGPLGRMPFAEILEYEAEFARSVARDFPVMTLCQYDARGLSGLDVAGLLQHHDGGLH